MKLKHLLFLAVISTVFFSCNKSSKSDNFDYGTFENGKYSNSFFNLEFTVPADWYVLSQEQNVSLMNKSDEFVSEENKALQQAVETSKITTVILFTGSQYGLELADSIFNPNIMLLAENVGATDKVKSPSDYLHITRSALQQDSTPKSFPFNSFQIEKISNSEFAIMRVLNQSTDNKEYTQDYYVSIQKDFALTFILTYNSELQKIALEQILNTLVIQQY